VNRPILRLLKGEGRIVHPDEIDGVPNAHCVRLARMVVRDSGEFAAARWLADRVHEPRGRKWTPRTVRQLLNAGDVSPVGDIEEAR
jgi:hypothetical protein